MVYYLSVIWKDDWLAASTRLSPHLIIDLGERGCKRGKKKQGGEKMKGSDRWMRGERRWICMSYPPYNPPFTMQCFPLSLSSHVMSPLSFSHLIHYFPSLLPSFLQHNVATHLFPFFPTWTDLTNSLPLLFLSVDVLCTDIHLFLLGRRRLKLTLIDIFSSSFSHSIEMMPFLLSISIFSEIPFRVFFSFDAEKVDIIHPSIVWKKRKETSVTRYYRHIHKEKGWQRRWKKRDETLQRKDCQRNGKERDEKITQLSVVLQAEDNEKIFPARNWKEAERRKRWERRDSYSHTHLLTLTRPIVIIFAIRNLFVWPKREQKISKM